MNQKAYLFKAQFKDAIRDILGLTTSPKDININWRSIYCYLQIVHKLETSDVDEIDEALLIALEKTLYSNDGLHIRIVSEVDMGSEDVKYVLNAFKPQEDDQDVRGDFTFGPFLHGDVAAKQVLLNTQQALHIIEKYLSDYYQETITYLEEILIVGMDNGRGIRSGSTINTFGCIVNRPSGSGDILQLVEDIIHETIHHRIYIEQLEDEILLSSDSTFYPAPFREDGVERPLSTQYHSAHVCGHVAIAMDRLVAQKFILQESQYDLVENTQKLLDWHKHCCHMLRSHARMTKRGMEMLEDTIEAVSGHFGARYVG